ncbi:hypothetical protein [Shivajiella indica]|uniref:DUF1007 family protein n=1 Tax=Shivajiella indica TaxID=872115 RepID=A0ABW5BCW1_9BACT
MLPILSHFCLALMLTILANGVLFFHSHELENGRIITHAHPILTQDLQESSDHGHTEMELIILDLIAHAEYFVYDTTIEIPELIESVNGTESIFISQEFFSEVSIGFDLRGPPASVA